MNWGYRLYFFSFVTVLTIYQYISCSIETKQREWSVLVFMEGRNNLQKYLINNVQQMVSVGSSDSVSLLVQWYQPDYLKWSATSPTLCRGIIKKGEFCPQEVPAPEDVLSNNYVNDLVDAMSWMVNEHPAKHYALILASHGTGIIDPLLLPAWRGILFNEQDKNYLTNTELETAFALINSYVLKGKKIDLVGMDACYMSMLEICYQLKDHAHYFVGSQDKEIGLGWNYALIFNELIKEPMPPENFARLIVQASQTPLSESVKTATRSLVNLSAIDAVKENINEVTAALQHTAKTEKSFIYSSIVRARGICQDFYFSNYIDLHSFYTELLHALNDSKNIDTKITMPLRLLLIKGINLIEKSVLHNCTSPYLFRAKGLSIYFPYFQLDSGYKSTSFGKETLWGGFIEDHIGSIIDSKPPTHLDPLTFINSWLLFDTIGGFENQFDMHFTYYSAYDLWRF